MGRILIKSRYLFVNTIFTQVLLLIYASSFFEKEIFAIFARRYKMF